MSLDQAFVDDPQLAERVCWSPRQTAITAVQQHWIVQDGRPPTPAVPSLLASAASALTTLDLENDLLFDCRQFQVVARMLIEHAGVFNHGPAVQLHPSFQFAKYYRLDESLLRHATLGSETHPNGFTIDSTLFHSCLAALSSTSAYRTALASRVETGRLPADNFLHGELWWHAGVRAQGEMGWHLPMAVKARKSPLQKLICFLEAQPDRIVKLDAWVKILGQSALLSSLVRLGYLSEHGEPHPKLRVSGVFQLAELLGCKGRSKYESFREVIWPALKAPVFRRAFGIRRSLLDVSKVSSEPCFIHSFPDRVLEPDGRVPATGAKNPEMLAAYQVAKHIKDCRLILSSELRAKQGLQGIPRSQLAMQGNNDVISAIDHDIKEFEMIATSEAEKALSKWRSWRSSSGITVVPKILDEPEVLLQLERPRWPGDHQLPANYDDLQSDDESGDESDEESEDLELDGQDGAGLRDQELDREEQMINGGYEVHDDIDTEGGDQEAVDSSIPEVPAITWPLQMSPPLSDLKIVWSDACCAELARICDTSTLTNQSFFLALSAIETILRDRSAAMPWLVRFGFIDGQTGEVNDTEQLAGNAKSSHMLGEDTFNWIIATIAAIPIVFPQLVESASPLWTTIVENVALALALLQCSPRHYLFVHFSTLLLDNLSRTIVVPPRNDPTFVARSRILTVIHMVREYSIGATVSASVCSKSVFVRDSESTYRVYLDNKMRWSSALVSPCSRYGFLEPDGGTVAFCDGCAGQRPLIPAANVTAIRQQDRLTVSTATIRRGAALFFTRGLGHVHYFTCLSSLYNSRYHREFIPVFVAFASLLHQVEKVGFHKASFVVTGEGPCLIFDLAVMEDVLGVPSDI